MPANIEGRNFLGEKMISDLMSEELSKQYTRECESVYYYMFVSSYFSVMDLDGFANWMQVQAREEGCHAQIFFNYLCEQDRQIAPGVIHNPKLAWDDLEGAIEFVLKQEQSITSYIHSLVSEATAQNDHVTYNFLQWFVEEQAEEEALVRNLLGRIKINDGNGAGLLLLDSELKTRTLVVPAKMNEPV